LDALRGIDCLLGAYLVHLDRSGYELGNIEGSEEVFVIVCRISLRQHERFSCHSVFVEVGDVRTGEKTVVPAA
jgi:hypothetical protein